LVGTPIYRVHLPTGSPMKSLVAVFIASFKKRKVEVPADTTILFEGDEAGPNKLEHTDGFRYVYHILMEAKAANIVGNVSFSLFVEQKKVTYMCSRIPH
jgi:hypothetical protein